MPRNLIAPYVRASRSLRRAPGFVAIATLSLGAALGLSTSVFALIDAMRHPASPFRDVNALFEVHIFAHSRLGPSRREIEEALAGIPEVERLATAGFTFEGVETTSGSEQKGIALPRPGFWELLGVRPRLGRLPTPAESQSASVAVVSDAFWRRRFENRPRIDGEVVSVGDRQYPVIGVLPNGANSPFNVDVWIPDPAPGAASAGVPMVRLRRGDADTTRVNAQLKIVMQRFTRAYVGPREQPFGVQLRAMRPDPLTLKDFHLAMAGAAVCILLIACANVSALMLARGAVRRRDFALRLALGASRREIAREVLTEVLVLALLGCVAGALTATWAVGLITRATPEEMHWYGFVQPQWSVRVLAMSACALFVSVAVAGGFPAWQASHTDPAGLLKESSGGNTGRAGTRFRWLVMAELALAMTLAVGASLMIQSTTLMARYEFGYDARHLLAARSWLMGRRDTTSTADQARLFLNALAQLRALPGVRGAATLVGCGALKDVVSSDRTAEGGASAYIPGGCTNVSSDFFGTLGIPILDGRDFSEGDALTGGAVILDQKTARRLFPHERAVGRMIKLGDMASREPWLRVVGIVRDQPLSFNPNPEAGSDTSAKVYASLPVTSGRLRGWQMVEFVVRPSGNAKTLPVEVARALRASLPRGSYVQVRPWTSSYEDSLRQEQYLSLLFSLLGAASLALGAAGLFSVVSYIASQRMREFAVRVALGATRDNLLRLVMREALAMALGGTAVGAGLGMWAGFLLWDKMWGVYPVDAGALVAAEVTLLLVTLLACLAPAMRAARADPVDVMRAT